MPKFTQRPVTVDAIQYTAPIYSNIKEFIESFGDNPKEVVVKVLDDPNEHLNVSNMSGTSHLAIRTPKGDMKFTHGDWIVRDESGRYWRYDDLTFNIIYQSV